MADSFDYGTYWTLLGRLQETHRLVRFRDFVDRDVEKPFVILRHDVDYSPAAALTLAEQEASRSVTATYFLLPGSPYYNLLDPHHSGVARALAEMGHEVGLHPSYAAYDHPGRLRAEYDRLGRVLGEAPRVVRTHYLRWAEPATPRLLAQTGFRLDSSLGLSARPGFRRAVATPFRLFDRHANQPLDLWELPLAVMDTTLFTHMGLASDAVETAAWSVCDAARRVGGCAVLLWHNWSTDARAAAERLGVLARVLDRARADGAFVGAMGEAVAAWRAGGDAGT